jgi:phosphoglycerol transferase MdoB-like AlkP superfamily enzyme
MINFAPRLLARRAVTAMSLGVLNAWFIALSVAFMLSALRAMQVAYLWPSGFEVSWADLSSVLLHGGRFDLKVSAAAVVLLLPLLFILPSRLHGWLGGVVAILLVAASLVNLHYFSFYKTPIDSIIFGLFEDDTQAIMQTIWRDFPVALTLGILLVLTVSAIALRKRLHEFLVPRFLALRLSTWHMLIVIVFAVFILALTIKGTLRAMALGRQNTSVTTSQFLNDMVPNGAIALNFAWDNRLDSQNLNDPLLGLKNLGFHSPMQAAHVLGIEASNSEALRQSLYMQATKQTATSQKNLLFFLMESWSAEPFLYHAHDFNMLGRLAPTMDKACHFSNFDSAQPGTHPSLEAILFSSPITPLTLGPQGKKPIPWAIPLVMQQAGYHTLFVTSARSGWRDLDRVLKVQGFDEVVDANQLKSLYPEAFLGIWGVWDSYVFQYLSERLKKPQGDKPLFVFVLTSTNHPPYDLPTDYQRQQRNMDKWGGERNSDTLLLNLDSYHYATDLLGGLVHEVQSSKWRSNTVIAATGDHNVRSFGLYATPERRYLGSQVPFVVWGDGVDCGMQRQLPASHRDMFPTLFPLVGVGQGYLKTGRNLLTPTDGQSQQAQDAPRSLSYTGVARNAKGSWTLGNAASFGCTPMGVKADASCQFDAKQDAQERARLGLLDWNVRISLK